ncbi:MAG: hypothetical protein H8E42_07200 [Nitrospinae bacterium]|nr:hypothetical protein [Nitrospinota bacterium]MBL7020305.1 hypothetical protein [Nitrospinaceae bacterium]
MFLLTSVLFVCGCGTTGKDFNESLYKNIVVGTTTHKEIQAMFGPPFKKGIQNGYKIWTYEYNFYNSLGKDITKDMIIVFTQSGVVKSHQMMTNQP